MGASSVKRCPQNRPKRRRNKPAARSSGTQSDGRATDPAPDRLDRGKALTQRLNSLALSQEAFIAENYGDKATADLKRLLESLIEKAN
jgi:hypothetical protein